MISYEKIHNEHTNSTLSESEYQKLKEMEEFTDQQISSQFSKGYHIQVDASTIDKLASVFGVWRCQVLIDKWRKMYEDGGWSVNYDSGISMNCWVLTQNK
jgi:hypothetical protein